MSRKTKMPDARIVVEETENPDRPVDMFVEFDGKRIAKRGHPGTPQAKTWVSLEPGYVVTSSRNHDANIITIEYNGVRVH
jgi:hypothetical protein